MRALPPAWYVVLYNVDPPVAVPLSSAYAANSFCAALRVKGTQYMSLAVNNQESTSTRLLEKIAAGDPDAKRHALRALNWHLLDARAGWGSLCACSVCDGAMYEPTQCGCCARPDCAVRCGCRCPSEFATCDGCDERVAACAGANVDEQRDAWEPCSGCGNMEIITELGFCVSCVNERGLKYGDEECIVCGRPGELDDAEWCRSCERQHAFDTATPYSDDD